MNHYYDRIHADRAIRWGNVVDAWRDTPDHFGMTYQHGNHTENVLVHVETKHATYVKDGVDTGMWVTTGLDVIVMRDYESERRALKIREEFECGLEVM